MNRLSMEKILFHTSHIEKIKKKELPFPIHFIVGLTTRCNHRCQWCSVYGSVEEKTIDIDPDILLARLKQAKALGLEAVTYIGRGEPLFYRWFSELVKEVDKIGLQQACFTNGSLLHRYSDEIMRSFLWFRVSLDAATQKQHSILHGAKNDFDRIISSLSDMVKDRGNFEFPTIGVQFGLHQRTLNELFNSAKLVKNIGVDYFSIKPIYNRGRVGVEIEKNVLKVSDIQDEVDKTLALSDETFDVYYKPYQFELMDNPDLFTRAYRKCYGSHFEWHLFENGDLMICGPMRLKVGNIYDNDPNVIFTSEAYQQMIADIDIEKCYKGCRMHALNELLWSIENPDESLHVNFI